MKNFDYKSILAFLILTAITGYKCLLFRHNFISPNLVDFDYGARCINLAVLSAALFVGALAFLERRPWISLLVSLLLDTWIVAIIVYYRANGLILTFEAISMTSNLNGFTSAITAYLSSDLLVYPLLSIGYALPFFFLKHERHPWLFVVVLIGCITCSISASYMRKDHRGAVDPLHAEDPITLASYNPFITADEYLPELWLGDLREYNYIMQHSIAAYGIQVFVVQNYRAIVHKIAGNQLLLNDNEQAVLNQVLSSESSTFVPSAPLVMVLVESWESWVLDARDLHGQPIMPNFTRWLSESSSCVIANRMEPQVRHGVSGDGLMTMNTGLLPLEYGAACILYGNNVYPNLAHFYPSSVMIDPCKLAWNNAVTAHGYGYKKRICPTGSEHYQDAEIFRLLREECENQSQPACLLALTFSTHSPFHWVNTTHLDLPSDFPDYIQDYLSAMHYTDSCLGEFLAYADTAQYLKSATFVFTGDHTFIRNYGLGDEVKDVFVKNQFPLSDELVPCVPLVVVSPTIQQSKTVDMTTYQMDIYPTVMNAIGVSDYFWKGFGINLLNEDAESARQISPQDALHLSDYLITSNYFDNLE